MQGRDTRRRGASGAAYRSGNEHEELRSVFAEAGNSHRTPRQEEGLSGDKKKIRSNSICRSSPGNFRNSDACRMFRGMWNRGARQRELERKGQGSSSCRLGYNNNNRLMEEMLGVPPRAASINCLVKLGRLP